MGEIYRSCSSTYIWLGSTDLRTNPFEIPLHFAANRHFYELPCFEKSHSTERWSLRTSSSFETEWTALKDASTRPWWSRLWCVQEVLLSPKALLVLGQWRIPWATLKLSQQRHIKHLTACCSEISKLFSNKYLHNSDQILISTQLDPQDQNRLLPHVDWDLDVALRKFRHKLCKDPRDRIYGLLGLIEQRDFPRIRPDYGLTVDQVFIGAMRTLIEHSHNDLRYFTGSGFNSGQYNIPSWVRNFSAGIDSDGATYEVFRHKAYPLYDAAYSTESDVKVLSDKVPTLAGTYVDTIKLIGSPVQKRLWTHVWEVANEWHNSVFTSKSQGLDPMMTRELWRILISDVVEESEKWRRATKNDKSGKAMAAWLEGTPRVNDECSVIAPDARHRSIMTATHGRAMCRTSQGHVGLCFPDTRPGDEVWVLHGGRVPFVLRPIKEHLKEDASVTTDTYALIGEAYLHKFMDGEAVRVRGHLARRIFLK
jgi:hypothetical protein